MVNNSYMIYPTPIMYSIVKLWDITEEISFFIYLTFSWIGNR